mmetsp:Transcript_37796/g.90402  ORF Transcript_37796/g.90402 Transcript_37796/m.90402 type:complete len:207 (+) Transcript_37796:165-785(+)
MILGATLHVPTQNFSDEHLVEWNQKPHGLSCPFLGSYRLGKPGSYSLRPNGTYSLAFRPSFDAEAFEALRKGRRKQRRTWSWPECVRRTCMVPVTSTFCPSGDSMGSFSKVTVWSGKGSRFSLFWQSWVHNWTTYWVRKTWPNSSPARREKDPEAAKTLQLSTSSSRKRYFCFRSKVGFELRLASSAARWVGRGTGQLPSECLGGL